MAINVGYVIECDNPAYEGKAKVRIPALHGTPLIGSTFTNINNQSFISLKPFNLI